MDIFAFPSLVGLLIQAIGVMLISVLCIMLMRTAPRDPLFYWSVGWLLLFVGLVWLLLSFKWPAFAPVGQPFYLFCEYVFGYMVFAGCRQYATGRRLRRRESWLFLPAAIVAVALPSWFSWNFDRFFAAQTILYASLFVTALVSLRGARPHARGRAGLHVVKLALLLLSISYLHYAPLFWFATNRPHPITLPYLQYSSFYDLLFLFLLMFGMMMVVTGEVQHELELTNVELGRARDRLETMAQLAHLTSALNRHALYSLIEEPNSGRRSVFNGSAVVADMDQLKAINDRYGHLAGDSAIRAVASAIRQVIRADDLLFRWGGDEFLVLLIGLGEAEARDRFAAVNASLKRTRLPELSEPIDISVSMGFALFESARSLSQVIAIADEAMFRRKRTTGC